MFTLSIKVNVYINTSSEVLCEQFATKRTVNLYLYKEEVCSNSLLNSRILYDNASMWLSEIDFTLSTSKHLGCFQEYFEPHLISFHLTNCVNVMYSIVL